MRLLISILMIMRLLCERIIELDGELFDCLVNFEKVFDRVK